MSSGQTLGVKAQRFRGHTSPHRNVKEKKNIILKRSKLSYPIFLQTLKLKNSIQKRQNNYILYIITQIIRVQKDFCSKKTICLLHFQNTVIFLFKKRKESSRIVNVFPGNIFKSLQNKEDMGIVQVTNLCTEKKNKEKIFAENDRQRKIQQQLCYQL
eukprot:TRINITY_DN5556_c0_g1_i1.p1 TRINITY_DN5556_c0_g1~~TRINITY_DN5556_c0_g1_i1.p1  ORF type:complete len:166 (+),score=8.05 TRINITY_DN5556_c0_g1_i1:29-499(+)